MHMIKIPPPTIDHRQGESTYQITVRGEVDPAYIIRMYNISVVHNHSNNETLSTLTGTFTDQAAVSGILNILADYQFELLAVNKL